MAEVFATVKDLKAWRRKQDGLRVGIVPTMGALHAGHGTLIEAIRPKVDRVVMTLFVNPKQFGPSEDFDRYPRAFESDVKLAESKGVDTIFAPSLEEIYPEGFSTRVEEQDRSKPLCGIFRPVFFGGITTVVLKLFHLVEPHLAAFGKKDAQQYYVIQKMIEDLHMSVELLPVETVREADGLAMSSRNAYLSAEERERAPRVYRELNHALDRMRAGMGVERALSEAKMELDRHGFKTQYFDLRTVPDLSEARSLEHSRHYLLAVAAYLGATRLIDNLEFEF